MSPVSVFTASQKVSACFAQFMSLKIDYFKKPEDAVIEQEGFNVYIFGRTELSENNSKCGDSAIMNLSPYFI